MYRSLTLIDWLVFITETESVWVLERNSGQYWSSTARTVAQAVSRWSLTA